jgi:transcriptional regulator
MSHRGSRHPSPTSMESTSTVRERIVQALREAQLTAREISATASVREHDVADHLRHLERSLLHAGEQLQTEAPHCIQCGFLFSQRERHSRPSRCPRCKSERISPPRFKIVRSET